jgi:hypothetical protein
MHLEGIIELTTCSRRIFWFKAFHADCEKGGVPFSCCCFERRLNGLQVANLGQVQSREISFTFGRLHLVFPFPVPLVTSAKSLILGKPDGPMESKESPLSLHFLLVLQFTPKMN